MRASSLDALRRAALSGVPGLAPLPEREAPDARRVVAGRVAQDAGASLERWLAAQHRAATALGVAHVRHVGPPVAHGGSRGQHLTVIGKGPADYQGVIRGGRAVAIEAKSRDLRLSRAEIPEHQQHDLETVERLGGLALLVIEIREAQLVAAVPWTEVPWRVSSKVLERGKPGERTVRSETVGAEELASWRVVPGCYLRRWA